MIGTKMYFTNGGGFKVPSVKYLQNTMDATKKYPIIVFAHGNSEQGDGTDSGLNRLYNSTNHANILKFADQFGFVVFAPQFVQAYNYAIIGGVVSRTWQPEWTGGTYFNDAIDWAIANMPVDPTRVYITGLSGGGTCIWSYVSNSQQYADKIAAAAVLCGTELSGTPNWDAAKTVPIRAYCGDRDAFYGANVRQAEKANAKLITLLGYNHDIWTETYGRQELYEWFLSNVNVPSPAPIPIEPFKPTHIIKRSDGSSESVRIETL